MVPIAPFALVNLFAGASGVRFLDFVLGTLIGMTPGMILLTALGHHVFLLVTEPTTLGLVLLVIIVLGWIALAIVLQYILIRMRRSYRA
jgi:phospholipase D1/2